MAYIVYLDEFGHIGPYVTRDHSIYNESPVFGLAGFALPVSEVRGFGTWFYKQKCSLLEFEINRSQKHPATWEKKGASLYTATNVKKYRELRNFTNRLFNKIDKLDGFVFYVGSSKKDVPLKHEANQIYKYAIREAIKRLDQHFTASVPQENFLLTLDEHDQRSALITEASIVMYGKESRSKLVEPPFQVESHRYQTMQAADWIAGLVGRLGAIWKSPTEYEENEVFRTYFEQRLAKVSVRSGIRS